MSHPLAPTDALPALRAWVTLRRAAAACADVLDQAMAAADLTESQFGVLEALHHKGPLHPCELATKILRTSGNLTLVIDRLEQRGLLRRERSAADRRYVTVHLTDAGTALVTQIFPAHAERVAELFSVFSPDDCRRFGDACRTLGLHAASQASR